MAAGGDRSLAARLLVRGGADPMTGVAVADSVLAAGSAVDIAAAWIAAGAAWSPAALAQALDAQFVAAATAAVPVAGLTVLFERLHDHGIRLGIASSDSERAVRRTVDHFGLAGRIDFVAGYDSGFGCKPDPGMVLAFCRATGLAAADVAVVGDNAHDLIMGRRAGAGTVIGVLTGTGTLETLSPLADLCLPSVADLNRMIGTG